MRSRCQSRAWASFIIPRCATPSRETRVAGDNFAARGVTLCDDIAKLCPARVCSITRRTRFMRSQGCRRRVSFTAYFFLLGSRREVGGGAGAMTWLEESLRQDREE